MINSYFRQVCRSGMGVSNASRPVVCKECSMRFSTQSKLDCHLRDNCQRDGFVCEPCKKSFFNEASLAGHKQTHLSWDDPKALFVCEPCKKSFFDEASLAGHKQSHLSWDDPKALFVCEPCKKSFCNEASLASHKQSHLSWDDPKALFVCEPCKKSFCNEASLASHKQSHHDRARAHNTSCICPTCGKSFARPKRLSDHIELYSSPFDILTNEKKRCTLCHVNFRSTEMYEWHSKSCKGPQ